MTSIKITLSIMITVLLTGLVPVGSALATGPETGEVFTLGEVVVTADGGAANSATSVTEVTKEEIAAKGASTAAEALEFLPGVFVQSVGKGEVQVSLRGFKQNQVKVLIDGVPARESYFGTVDLSMLPADAISKVTITKGASSVLYGANTMGGVINIVTKKGGATPQTALSAAFGDYGTAHYSLNHGGSQGQINYWLAGGYQTSNGFRLSSDFDPNDPVVGEGTAYNEDGGKRDLSDYTKKNLDLKVGYDPGGPTSLYLSTDYVDSERGMPTFYNRYWAYNHWRQWQVNLVGEHRFAEALTLKSRFFYVNHQDGITDVSWDADHTTGGKKWFEESYYDDRSLGGELQATSRLGQWNTVRLALHFMADTHQEANYLSSDCWDVQHGAESVGWTAEEEYAAQTYAFAVEDEIVPMEGLSIIPGLSYDAFKPTQTADRPEPGQMDTLNPQLGVVYDLTAATELHASVGKKTRFPSLKELYSTYGGGNPDLDPEEAVAYEAGVTHAFSDRLHVKAALFYNDIDNLIDTVKLAGNSFYINVNEAVIYGAEAGLDLQVTPQFAVGLNYTYMLTEDKANNDRELAGRPRHRLNLSLDYRFDFGLSANLQAAYVQRQFWLDDSNQWRELPEYFLVNAKLTQQLGKVGPVSPELFIQGTNILDQDYYETNGPEPGCNFLAGVTLRM